MADSNNTTELHNQNHSQSSSEVSSQLKKRILDLCILAVLKRKDCYGYELVHEISQYIELSEGTIYTLFSDA